MEAGSAPARDHNYASIVGVGPGLKAHWEQQTQHWPDGCGGNERVGVIAPSKSGRINAAVTKPFVEFLGSKGFHAELLEPESQELLVTEVMDDGRFASLVVLPVSAGSAAKLAAIITDGKARKVRGVEPGRPIVPTFITIPVDMASAPGFVASTFVDPYARYVPSEGLPCLSAYPFLYLDSFKLMGEVDDQKHDLFWQYADLGRAFLDRRESVLKLMAVQEGSRARSEEQKVETADELSRVAGGSIGGSQTVNVEVNVHGGDDNSNSVTQRDGGAVAMGHGDAAASTINVTGAGAKDALLEALRLWDSGEDAGKARVRELLEGELVLTDDESGEVTEAVAEYLGGGALSKPKRKQFRKWVAKMAKGAVENTLATATEAAVKGLLS